MDIEILKGITHVCLYLGRDKVNVIGYLDFGYTVNLDAKKVDQWLYVYS